VESLQSSAQYFKKIESKIYFNREGNTYFRTSRVNDTWYVRFFRLLIQDTRRAELDNFFENVSFIVFNYDRCIGHFLVNALQKHSGVNEENAVNIMGNLKIIHPYGVVGCLPWQTSDMNGVRFGGEKEGTDILKISGQIRTFTEHVHDEESIDAIKGEVENADVIIFLGFAFYDQNMDILRPRQNSKMKRVLATTFGMPDAEREEVRRKILSFPRSNLRGDDIDLCDLKCFALFDERPNKLTRA
jgi:hypothetical protein